jgi:hypothetical protein
MSLSPLSHQVPPHLNSPCRPIRQNHKPLSSTSRMFVARIEAGLEGLAQSCPRLLNAALHHREYLNSANPESTTAAPQRQPPQIRCLPERRAPKDRGLPSPHPGWVIAQGLLQILSATTPNLVWRFFGSWIRTVRPGLAPSEQAVAVALRDTLPEFLATAAKTSILVKFILDPLDLSGTEGITLAA